MTYIYVNKRLTYIYCYDTLIMMSKLCYNCNKILPKREYYGLHKQCFVDWFKCNSEDKLETITPEQIFEDKELDDEFKLINSSFFQGKYKKYSGELAGKKYILKVREKEYPFMQKTEYLCNQIAEALNIKVADFFLIDFEGADCFLTENFLYQSNYVKLTHIYHYLDKKSEYNVETLQNVIFEITKRLRDVNNFLFLILYDSLIGNHDRHGRNLGLLSRGDANILSPIYDNCSYLGIVEKDFINVDLNPLGRISTKDVENPSMRDYCAELLRLNKIDILIDFKRKTKMSKVDALIEKSFLAKDYKNAFKKLVTKRFEEFLQFYESINI